MLHDPGGPQSSPVLFRPDEDFAADGDEAKGEESAERARIARRYGREYQLALGHEAETRHDQGAAPAAIGLRRLDAEFAAAGEPVGQRDEPALVAIDGDVLPDIAGVADARMVVGIGAAGQGGGAGSLGRAGERATSMTSMTPTNPDGPAR